MGNIGDFEFIEAESEELKKAIYRIRYNVYVDEYGFERIEDHPNGHETDEYDPYSIHYAALNATHDIIGTIRMVLHSDKGFPIEHAIRKLDFVGEKPEPNRIAEISRLAVIRNYRRRREDGLYGLTSYVAQSEEGILPYDDTASEGYHRRRRPIIVFGLYRAIYHASKKMGITHWYLITEKELHDSFEMFGFLFHQIGEPVSYHGVRIPYLGIISEMEEHLRANNPDMLQLMLDGLEEQYHPRPLT